MFELSRVDCTKVIRADVETNKEIYLRDLFEVGSMKLDPVLPELSLCTYLLMLSLSLSLSLLPFLINNRFYKLETLLCHKMITEMNCNYRYYGKTSTI